jgi:hypothetical protein
LIGSGNSCGHDPARPRLDPHELASERLPPVLHEAIGAIENLFYQRHHARFADIGEARRSEICEAMVLVGRVELARMDIVTKRVGTPRDDGIVVGVTAERIAKATGLSISRTNRAFAEFAAAGWMTSCQPCELKADGTYRGYPAIRTFTHRFFEVIRCSIKLAAAAAKAHKARKAARELAQRGAAELQRERLQRERARLERRNAARMKRIAGGRRLGDTDADQDERGRRLAELQLQIRTANPQWPPERWRAAALEQLGRKA